MSTPNINNNSADLTQPSGTAPEALEASLMPISSIESPAERQGQIPISLDSVLVVAKPQAPVLPSLHQLLRNSFFRVEEKVTLQFQMIEQRVGSLDEKLTKLEESASVKKRECADEEHGSQKQHKRFKST
jgi:hypothetical protein